MKKLFLSRYRYAGLLILRIGFGVMFIIHGLPKLSGGVTAWTRVGGAMQYVGIDFLPAFWGFMAACSEVFGGVLLMLGFLFRPACLMLLATMAVAATMHFGKGDGFNVASHAIEDGIVFLSLLFIGPGKYSIDKD